jgi:hypothetical protein
MDDSPSENESESEENIRIHNGGVEEMEIVEHPQYSCNFVV